jgi:hypothetical protein
MTESVLLGQHAHKQRRVLALISSVRLAKRSAARLDAGIVSDVMAKIKRESSIAALACLCVLFVIAASVHCEALLDSCLRRNDRVGCSGPECTPTSGHPLDGSLVRVPIPGTGLSPLRRQGSRKRRKRTVLWVRRVCPSRRLGVWDGLSTLHGIASWTGRGYKRHEVAGLPRRIVPLMGVV